MYNPYLKQYAAELEQYALGDWLKKNAGTIGSVGGAVVGTALGSLIGMPSLGGSLGGQLGGAIGGNVQAKDQAETLAEETAEANKIKEYQAKIAAAKQNAQFKNGGVLPKYKGQTHSGPNGGIPVDEMGNPAMITNSKPVGLVEDGEFSHTFKNGNTYIFSNRLTL